VSNRRRALKVLAACTGAAAAGVAIVPSAAMLLEARRSQGNAGGRWVRVIRLSALAAGRPQRAWVVGPEIDAWNRAPDRRIGAVWLLRDGDSERVQAFSDACPHLGCAIELADGHFNCPCHESAFTLQGRRTTGPSPRDMDPIETRVADGWVSVKFRRFRQGSRERVSV